MTFYGFSNMVLAKVLFYKGDFAGAARVLQKLADIAQKHYLPLYISEPLAAWKARIWLAQNQLEPASQWVKARKLHADGELTSLLDYVIVVLARILLAQARLDEAARLLNRLLEAAESGGHTARTIEILVLQALTFQAGNNITQAKHARKRALTLAEPAGYVRLFVDEGPPMARLLHEARAQGITPDYIRRLLAAFSDSEPEPAAPDVSPANAALIEPLSERELDVLQHVAKGLTNREIAARLYLSLNTIKVHTRNIYGKLNVHNRTQAIAQARELGLLS